MDQRVATVTASSTSTEVPWSCATVCSENLKRGTPGAPACGPVEVTTVPTTTTAVRASMTRAATTWPLRTKRTAGATCALPTSGAGATRAVATSGGGVTSAVATSGGGVTSPVATSGG